MSKNKIFMSTKKPDHIKLRTALFMKIAVLPYEKLMHLIKVVGVDCSSIDFCGDEGTTRVCSDVVRPEQKPVLRLIQ